MNTKKLIGTIIGVIAFVALVAGATFAWITITAGTTNAIYNTGSRNFTITYNGGTTIDKVVMLNSGSATTAKITSATAASTTGDGWLAVTASKTATNAIASSFKINLSISTNTITSNSIVWAICKGNCPSTAALATVSGGAATCATDVTACGLINGGSKTAVTLYNDTTTFKKLAAVSATTYNIYFWLNADTIVEGDIGKKFYGFIYAQATQGETQ
ncbi:MAG: hypothetical protein IKI04_00240 [Bacilli bacterium]|nr:hypothetical protein [Bacilli bacterium]